VPAKANLGRRRGVFASVPFGPTPVNAERFAMPGASVVGGGVDVGDGDCDISTWKTRGRDLP